MQNVGTPRFYVSDVLFCLKNGKRYEESDDFALLPDTIFDIDPTNQHIIGGNYQRFTYLPITNKLNYIAFLGHNFASTNNKIYFSNNTDVVSGDNGNVNHPAASDGKPEQNGFSIHLFNEATYTSSLNVNLQFNPEDENEYAESRLGSVMIGKYYDLPHSPELSLTMTNEMDGVKRSRTKAGADIVNYRYTKSPMWGDLSPWELHDPINPTALDYQKISRVGRRVWDLSFNYLSASDLSPATEGVSKKITDPDAFDNEAENPIWNTGAGTHHNIMESDDFYSQVIHKTNGGALPFVFQPDSNNNNPDQFAICRLDMKSFVFDQVANGVYNVKLKIREAW